MRTAYSVYTSFLDRPSSCAPRRFRARRRQYGQHRTEPYSRTKVARYRPINQRDLRFDPEDPDAQVGPHGGPTATATRDAEMAEPSRSLQHRLIQSLLVAGRAGRPRSRARSQGQGYPCRQHEASRCLRPGGRKQAQGRTGDTPSRSGPASHRAQSHAPYTTRTDQEEHERPSLLCP